MRSGSLGILPACLPYTLKPHRTRHLLLSSFERLLQHINSSSCASLDYIYPTSSLSLSLSLNLNIPARTSPRLHPDQSCTHRSPEAVIRGGCLPSTSPLPQCQQSPSAIVSPGLHFIPETSIPVAYQPVRSIYIHSRRATTPARFPCESAPTGVDRTKKSIQYDFTSRATATLLFRGTKCRPHPQLSPQSGPSRRPRPHPEPINLMRSGRP